MGSHKISFVAGVLHTIVLILHSITILRVRTMYRNVDAKLPGTFEILFANWLFLLFLVFSILNFGFWYFLRIHYEKENKMPYALIIGLILLVAPFVLLYLRNLSVVQPL